MHFSLNLLLLLFIMATHVSASEFEPYVNAQSFFYSQPVPVKSIIGHWQPPFKEGNKAVTFNKAEMGIRWRNWQFGILNRYDYQLEFSSQTAEFIYLTKNRLPLEVGKEYELRIKALHNHSRGLRLGYQHKLSPKLGVGLAASYLQGKTLTDGNIQGTAQVTAENNYDFQFDADYFYSRDVLFERDTKLPKGYGYSLDFSVDWQANERLSAQLDIIDLVGKMFWIDAPFTTATASSATKTFDEDGYVLYKPTISGLESNKNFTQTLPRKIFLSSEYQWAPNIGLLAELQDYGVARFLSAGAGHCYNHNNCFQGLYNITAKALSLRYQGHGLRAEVASDQLNLNRARYFVIQLSFNKAL